MPGFRRFDYKTLGGLRSDTEAQGLDLPISDDISPLLAPLNIYGRTLKNRIVFQPMEGNDGRDDGSPSEVTRRKYLRYARGGAAVVWFESLAVRPDSRTSLNMLMPTKENLPAFKALLDEMRANGAPFTAAQLTHCGRYARLDGVPPVHAFPNPLLPGKPARIHTDAELEQIEDDYVRAAAVCESAGFDSLDIRACHGYLASELLGGFTRPGKYGGSFENRIRFLLNVVGKVGDATRIPLVVRLNAFDAVAKPYGWGTDERGNPDLSEPIALVKILYGCGVRLFNISATVGPFFPHLQRPYDRGDYCPEEHQLKAVAAMHAYAAAIKKACPQAVVCASAFSWLRQFGANAAAGGIGDGRYDLAGWGREIFAYPDFPNDLRAEGKMDSRKCCVSCSHCITLMAHKLYTGCIIRDSEFYMPLFKSVKEK